MFIAKLFGININNKASTHLLFKVKILWYPEFHGRTAGYNRNKKKTLHISLNVTVSLKCLLDSESAFYNASKDEDFKTDAQNQETEST